MMTTALLLVALAPAATQPSDLPVVTVDRDDVVIRESCRIAIPRGLVIADVNGDGVIQVGAPNLTLVFESGSVLRGAGPDVAPDTYDGIGMRIDGHAGVTVRDAVITGFRCGLWATRTDGLVLEHLNVSGIRRDRLRSTPLAEDARDWLWPHANDANEWLERYGAGIYIEDSRDVTVRLCKARDAQNGLCLDRVEQSRIFDNDFSFLSGWGIALWRSSRNIISRNAVDFCVRGYSHEVYNRGQDSAGILAFEQCSQNVFAENSATHGGDGFFGFAGKEALGEAPAPAGDFDYRRRGCNDNVFVGNDFSSAAAHGLELTFSFGNRIHNNTFRDNAICGIWAGYSQDTTIDENEFELNGAAGYGFERGGVNIEHGRGNRIIGNRFRNNAAGVHLWWDDDGALFERPWVKANGADSTDNLVVGNTFFGDMLAVQLRGPSDATVGQNDLERALARIDARDDARLTHDPNLPPPNLEPPAFQALGQRRPVGARPELKGRDKIVMTEWGPWDHVSPMMRLRDRSGGVHTYDVGGLPPDSSPRIVRGNVSTALTVNRDGSGVGTLVISAHRPGVYPYTLVLGDPSLGLRQESTLVVADWDVTVFPWQNDPREDVMAWRREAKSPQAVTIKQRSLVFPFAYRRPQDVTELGLPADMATQRDRFGVWARTTLTLPKGRWKVSTLSDDGVRVIVDGKPVLDNWTQHGTTVDEAYFEQPSTKPTAIVVEYFELDGHAILVFDLSPADEVPAAQPATQPATQPANGPGESH